MDKPFNERVEVIVTHLGEVEIIGQEPQGLVILTEKEGGRILQICFSPVERLQAMLAEYFKVKSMRPTTYGLMENIVKALGGTISEVIINDVKNDIFHATILVNGEEIDARPGDAIALALKCDIPIFVSEEVMATTSISPEDFKESFDVRDNAALDKALPKRSETQPKKETRRLPSGEKNSLEALKIELEEVIAAEDYERAAELRDRIKELQSEKT